MTGRRIVPQEVRLSKVAVEIIFSGAHVRSGGKACAEETWKVKGGMAGRGFEREIDIFKSMLLE